MVYYLLSNNYTIFVNMRIFDRGTMGTCKISKFLTLGAWRSSHAVSNFDHSSLHQFKI